MVDLQNYQFQYRGLLWGAHTKYGVSELEGLDGLDVRSSPKEFARHHGDIPSAHYANSKLITFGMHIDSYLGSADDAEEDLDEFRRVITVYESLDADRDRLYVRLPSKPQKYIRCRPITAPVVRSASPGPHILEFNMIFEAPDPRLYHYEEQSLHLPVYDTSGAGTDFPLEFPVNWPANTSTQRIAKNEGNALAHPVIRIYGPDTGTTTRMLIRNVTNGHEIDIETPLVTGQILTLDMEAVVNAINRLPVHVDGATRYADWKLPREPFGLSPGDNTLRFDAEGSVSGLSARVNWHSVDL